jgi:hypothetical protein
MSSASNCSINFTFQQARERERDEIDSHFNNFPVNFSPLILNHLVSNFSVVAKTKQVFPGSLFGLLVCGNDIIYG